MGGAIGAAMLSEKQNDLENDKKIIDIIRENPTISINELAQLVGVSIKTIRTTLNKLKQMGQIERIGPDKGGYWQINEEHKP